jgi:hypothetical protein
MAIPQSLKDIALAIVNSPKAEIKAGTFVKFTHEEIEYKGVVFGFFINAYSSYLDRENYNDITISDVISTISVKVWTTTDEEWSIKPEELTEIKYNPFTE